MSSLAQLSVWEGHFVTGSDRSHDQGRASHLFEILEKQGIILYPEDGSGVTPECDRVVLSAAIERGHPDWESALTLGIPTVSRAQELSSRFQRGKAIAVAGTSGKSTTTAMLSHILIEEGMNPEVLCGAQLPSLQGTGGLGNARRGDPDLLVAEVDESDETLCLVRPTHALLTNLGKDHKPVDELLDGFKRLMDKTREVIVYSGEDDLFAKLASERPNSYSYGLSKDFHLGLEVSTLNPWNSHLVLEGISIVLPVPGLFNARNAAAAVACAVQLGLSAQQALKRLETFKGVLRRMEWLGSPNGIAVIDDFAHNPDKVASVLEHLSRHFGRRFVYFQPHGFGPLRFFHRELCQAFLSHLTTSDALYLAPVYYAGGSATRDISSEALRDFLCAQGLDTRVSRKRSVFVEEAASQARPGDVIAILGARDPTLSDLAQQVHQKILSASSSA